MIKRIEHLGIAVDNLESAMKTYEDLFGKEFYKSEIVESEFVKRHF